jgi:hypothetical protein
VADVEQDWGESSGARLAEAKEENSHKRFELQFQIGVLALLSVVALILVMLDLFAERHDAKELLIVILPAFTFVLGKMDKRNG